MVHIARKLGVKVYGKVYSIKYNLFLKDLVVTGVNIKLRIESDIFPLISVGNVLYIPHRLLVFINGTSENIQTYPHYHFLNIDIN